MLNYLLICRSITYAQRTAKVLEANGINAVVVRLPKNITIDGCGYCVRVPGRRITDALVAVKNAGLPPVRIYARNENGIYGEVDL